MITLSPCLLMTDYIALGGIGAALINAALTGLGSFMFIKRAKVTTNGAIVMALWLAVGFSFFGKNILNALPILLGVWVYARTQKDHIRKYSLHTMLSFTLTPAVSELAFGGHTSYLATDIALALFVGVLLGFLMPGLSYTTMQFHNGYNLYNAGLSAGILAIFALAVFNFFDITLYSENILSRGNNHILAPLIALIMICWIVMGFLGSEPGTRRLKMKEIIESPGRLVSDFYLLYGNVTYINMGFLGIIGMLLTLFMGAELNGIAIAGIFTIVGFGAFGKHPRNILPVLAGATAAAFLNPTSPDDPGNIGAILFSTGLAPIAGQFGIIWGFIAGFLHVLLNHYAGIITGGMNLYNNGFTAGFVAIVLVPLIFSLKQNLKKEQEKNKKGHI